ncbi:MAG: host attachment protein [Novosphingobium sp.]|nr:host attachment protein [Novosphingobium sp.]
MLIPHGTIIALVDGKNFELYRNKGDESDPELKAMKAPKLDQHNHSGGGHHSSSSNPTGHLADEDAHANAVTQWLNSHVLGHKIEQLIVIAAPRTLGEMRHHYHKQLERALVTELSKDLNGKQPNEILDALRNRK